MGSYNRIIVVGNLGRDAELRYTGEGTAVSNFSVATSETFKDKNGDKKETVEWFRVNYWGKGAEAVSKWLVKGKSVLVEGRIQSRKWTDKQGVEKVSVEVRADRVVLLGGGDGATAQTGGRPRNRPAIEDEDQSAAGHAEMPPDDEVPF